MTIENDPGVRLGLASLSPEPPARLVAAALARLTIARQERLRRLRRPIDLQRGVVADALAALLVAEAVDLEPGAVRVGRAGTGAPIVRIAGQDEESPYLSLAHAGDWVGCAIADTPIGLDLERIRPHAAARLAASLPAGPAAELWTLPEPERSRHAVRVWTAIEAYLKLLGTGLAVDPGEVRLMHAWGTRATAYVPGRPLARLSLLQVDPEHPMALAAESVFAAPRLAASSATEVLERFVATPAPATTAPATTAPATTGPAWPPARRDPHRAGALA